MKVFTMTMLLSLMTHGHIHSGERAMNAEGWEEVCSRYETPSVEHLRHYPYGTPSEPYYPSTSRGAPMNSVSRFID